MAFDQKVIDHLRQERDWYVERVAEVKSGTYPVEHRILGEVVDDRAETLERFERIVENIDALLHGAGNPDA
jgi:hypothetical protein